MSKYRVIVHPEFRAQYREFRQVATAAKDSAARRAARAGIRAMKALRDGQEAIYRGERLGFDKKHYDLRDCAEIKVDVLDERYPDGKPMGASHRMIYREFEPAGDDPRPIRQIVAFEHRKDGLPFKVAAERLGRLIQGRAVPELAHIPSIKPATGRKKDPNRPISPYRMPLPPDLAALLSTTQRTLPTRVHAPPGGKIRTADPPIRQRVRDR